MAQNFEARNSCQPGAAYLWRFRPSFQLFRLHILSYNSPISRFCPSGDASYGERPLDRATLARQWYEINNSTVVVADCRKFPFQPHRAVFDSALNFSMTKLAPPGTLIDVPPSLSTQALLFPMRLGVPAHCGAARGLSRFRDASIHGYCALRSGDVISRNVR